MTREVNVENLPKSSSMSLNDPSRSNVNVNPCSTTYRSVLIDETPNPACVDQRVFVNNTSNKPRASIFSRLQRDEHMSRGEDRENKRRSNAEPDHLAKRLSKETPANACPSSTKNSVSSIKVTYNPWNENTESDFQSSKSFRELANKPPARRPPNQFNNRLSTVIQTTDSPTLHSSITQQKPFKLIPVLPPNPSNFPVLQSNPVLQSK